MLLKFKEIKNLKTDAEKCQFFFLLHIKKNLYLEKFIFVLKENYFCT